MNFIRLTPAFRYAFWEAINLANSLLDLAQVARLVKRLLWCVLSIEVAFTINSSCKINTVVFNASHGLEVDDSDDLLVKFTGAIVQTVKWADVSLVNLMTSTDFWIRKVCPVISPEGSLVRCPSCKAMNQHDRIVVRPLVLRDWIVAAILEARLGLPVQASFFALIEVDKQLIKALDDESED